MVAQLVSQNEPKVSFLWDWTADTVYAARISNLPMLIPRDDSSTKSTSCWLMTSDNKHPPKAARPAGVEPNVRVSIIGSGRAVEVDTLVSGLALVEILSSQSPVENLWKLGNK